MTEEELATMKQRAAALWRARDWSGAAVALNELEQLEPGEPRWARRKAELYRRLGDRSLELEALVRAADGYARRGLVVQAIAACTRILSLDPRHAQTLDQLARLRGPGEPLSPLANATPLRPTSGLDAPLEEILLTEVVDGAHPVPLTETSIEGVNEIPIDGDHSAGDLDLGLSDADLHAMEEPAPFSTGTDEGLRTEAEATADSPEEQLRRTPLFGNLDADALGELISKVKLIEIAEGEVLFRQGDPADALYVIVDGAVVPIAEPDGNCDQRMRLAVLEAGDFFGEIGLVADQPRNATIEALVDTRMLWLDRRLMWHLIETQPGLFPTLLRFLRERLVDRLVRTSRLFRAFSHAERGRFAEQFRLLEVNDGASLVEQGQPSPGLIVLLTGRLDVILMDGEGDKVLASLRSGDVCGERSLLQREPAMASVVANGRSWVLVLDDARFRRILDRNPRLQQVIEGIMADREDANSTTMRNPIRSEDESIGWT